MSRCVIIGGVKIFDTAKVKSYINESDFIIACDSGIEVAKELGIKPNLIVGDFDSSKKPDTDIETITLPVVKDDTDTMFAAREAVKRGFDEVVLLGVIGERIDHTLANIYILSYLGKQGVNGLIVDDYSESLIIGENGLDMGKISDKYIPLIDVLVYFPRNSTPALKSKFHENLPMLWYQHVPSVQFSSVQSLSRV